MFTLFSIICSSPGTMQSDTLLWLSSTAHTIYVNTPSAATHQPRHIFLLYVTIFRTSTTPLLPANLDVDAYYLSQLNIGDVLIQLNFIPRRAPTPQIANVPFLLQEQAIYQSVFDPSCCLRFQPFSPVHWLRIFSPLLRRGAAHWLLVHPYVLWHYDRRGAECL